MRVLTQVFNFSYQKGRFKNISKKRSQIDWLLFRLLPWGDYIIWFVLTSLFLLSSRLVTGWTRRSTTGSVKCCWTAGRSKVNFLLSLIYTTIDIETFLYIKKKWQQHTCINTDLAPLLQVSRVKVEGHRSWRCGSFEEERLYSGMTIKPAI